MAAPTLVAATTGNTTSNATSIDVTTPSHSEGDLLVVAIAQDAPSTGDFAFFGAPQGWTFLFNEVAVDVRGTLGIAYKVAGANEPASYTFTSSNTERIVYVAWSVANHDGIDAAAVMPDSGSGALVSFPPVTTTVDDAMVFAVIATDEISLPHDTPSGYTAIDAIQYTSAMTISASYKVRATAGTETPPDTAIVSEQWATVTFAVAGAGGAGGAHNLAADPLTAAAPTLGSPALGEGFTLTLQPDATEGKDTRILSSLPNVDCGAEVNLSFGEANNSGTITRTLIQFDLSALPSNAEIRSAKLTFVSNSDLSSNTRTYRVYRLKRAWVEGTGNITVTGDGATWNASAPAVAWTTPGGFDPADCEQTGIGSVQVAHDMTVGDPIVFDLNVATKDDLDLGFGWLIKADTEVNDMWGVYSSDHSVAAERPKLVIQYTLPTQNDFEAKSLTASAPILGQPTLGADYSAFIDLYLDTQPAALWPLNETSGTVAINAAGNAAYNGTYVGGTVGAEGLLPGGFAFASDGTAGYVDLTAAVNAFDGSCGTVTFWFKPTNRAVWEDGQNRRLFGIGTDEQNYLVIQRTGALQQLLQVEYRADDVSHVISTIAFGKRTTWSSLTLSWSRKNDRLRFYLDGVQIMGTQTGLGAWQGAAQAIYAAAADTTPAEVWDGSMAMIGLWDRELSRGEILALAQRTGALPDAGERLTARLFGLGGTPAWSPDGTYIMYERHDLLGNVQVYVQESVGGPELCITDPAPPGAPPTELHKGWPKIHPTHDWAVLQVEIAGHPLDRRFAEPVRGLYNDIWIFKPSDLSGWRNLTNYPIPGPIGVLDCNFSLDGTKLMWAEKWAASSAEFYWGKWNIAIADFDPDTGIIDYANRALYAPFGDGWYSVYGEIEPGVLVIATDRGGTQPFTLDIFTYDIATDTVTAIEDSDTAWDEHGKALGNGELIYSSSRDYPPIDTAAIPTGDYTSLQGDIYFFDGQSKRRITRLNDPAFPESWDEPLYPTSQSASPQHDAVVFARHAHGASYGVPTQWRWVYIAHLMPKAALIDADVMTASTLTLGSASLGEIYELQADNLTAGAPVLGMPTAATQNSLAASSLTAGAALLGGAQIGQTHHLGAGALVGARALLDTPYAGGDMLAGDLIAALPILGLPILGQHHMLSTNGLIAGATVLGTPSMVEGIDQLAAQGLAADVMILGEPLLTHINACSAEGLTLGTPVVPSASLGQIHQLSANRLEFAVVTLVRPHLNLAGWVTAAERRLVPDAEPRQIVVEQENRTQLVAAERRVQDAGQA